MLLFHRIIMNALIVFLSVDELRQFNLDVYRVWGSSVEMNGVIRKHK